MTRGASDPTLRSQNQPRVDTSKLDKRNFESILSFDRKSASGVATRPRSPVVAPDPSPDAKSSDDNERAVHLRFLALDLRARIHLLLWTLQLLQPGLSMRLLRISGARLDMCGDGPRSDGSSVGDVAVLIRATDALLSRMATECGFRAQVLNDAALEGTFSRSSDQQDVNALESAARVRFCRLRALRLS